MGKPVTEPSIRGRNKRVAVTTIAAFLRLNGYALVLEDPGAYRFLIGLYETGRMRFAELDS